MKVDSIDALLETVAERAASKAIERAAELLGEARTEAPSLLDRTGLGRALGVSLTTVDRLVRDGCPHLVVVESRRFEIAKVLAWLETRGR